MDILMSLACSKEEKEKIYHFHEKNTKITNIIEHYNREEAIEFLKEEFPNEKSYDISDTRILNILERRKSLYLNKIMSVLYEQKSFEEILINSKPQVLADLGLASNISKMHTIGDIICKKDDKKMISPYYQHCILNNMANVFVYVAMATCTSKEIKDFLTLDNIIKTRIGNEEINKLISFLDYEDRKNFESFNSEYTIASILKKYDYNTIINFLFDKKNLYLLNDEVVNEIINFLPEELQERFQIPTLERKEYRVVSIYYAKEQNKAKKSMIEELLSLNASAFENDYSILENDILIENLHKQDLNFIISFEQTLQTFTLLDEKTTILVVKLFQRYREKTSSESINKLIKYIEKYHSNIKELTNYYSVEELQNISSEEIDNIFRILSNRDFSIIERKDDIVNYRTKKSKKIDIEKAFTDYEYFKSLFQSEEYIPGFGFSSKIDDNYSISSLVDYVLFEKFGISLEDAIDLTNMFIYNIDMIEDEILKKQMKLIKTLVDFFAKYGTSKDYKESTPYQKISSNQSEPYYVISKQIFKHILEEYVDDNSNENEEFAEFIRTALGEDEVSKIYVSDFIVLLLKKMENVKFDFDYFTLMEKLKREYMKLYNKKVLTIEECTKNQDGFYELPTDDEGYIKDFGMLVTSVSPFKTVEKIDDYYESWNVANLKSFFFCASYICRGMQSMAHIPHVCYGFCDLEDDSLENMSYQDIGSKAEVDSNGVDSTFLAPEDMTNYTRTGGGSFKAHRNEINIKRFTSKKRVQPSFIVLFKSGGKYLNKEESLKAQEDFRKKGIELPIIVVDRDKCLEAEKHHLDILKKEYAQTGNEELRKKINIIIDNNKKLENFISLHHEKLYKKYFENEDYIGEHQKLEKENTGYFDYICENYIMESIKQLSQEIPMDEQDVIFEQIEKLKAALKK